MKTKMLSLLLALFAFCSFSFGQDKHSHSFQFHDATNQMYGITDDIVFKDEQGFKDLTRQELKTFPAIDVETGEVTFGMFMDCSKYNHYLKKIGNREKFTTDCYLWVFELGDFHDTCNKKDMGELKIDETNQKFSLANFREYEACERISKLLGIDLYPEHTWLCTFTVPLKQIFRPAYQTSITVCNFTEDNGKWKVDLGGTEKFEGREIKNNDNKTYKISPKHWLGLLQQSKEYPWTRLGYTYDWGDESNHVGVSEFVIVPGTEVTKVKFYKESNL